MKRASVTAIAALAAVLGVPAGDDDDRREVLMRAGAFDQVIATTVDRLEDGDVLAILVTDGEPGARGVVRQCRLGPDDLGGCHNSFPILYDDEGRASFQYQLRDRGTCDAGATCVVAASTDDDVAMAFTVFGEEAPPPPTVRLSPEGPLMPGAVVRVDVSGLVPAAPVQVAFCAPTCARAQRAAAGADGSARLEVTVGDSCRRCAIVVVGGAAASRTPLTFVAPPSTRYDRWRVIVGLGAAAAFLLLAWRLVVTVDWRPPSEAATPELTE